MGASQSKDKLHCTRYLNGQGPPTLEAQANGTNSNIRAALINPGNQPEGGQMTWDMERRSLPGHEDCDTVQIIFHFEDGIQSDRHPHPGHRYRGLDSVSYLPNNSSGVKILRLLKTAFDHKLLFTVAADGSGEYCVMPADIPLYHYMPLKPQDSDGPECLTNPDPNYLKTVRKILKLKGIK